MPHPAFRFSPHLKSFFSILSTGASFGRSVAQRKNSFSNFGAAVSIWGMVVVLEYIFCQDSYFQIAINFLSFTAKLQNLQWDKYGIIFGLALNFPNTRPI